jgi:hypothetical protein
MNLSGYSDKDLRDELEKRRKKREDEHRRQQDMRASDNFARIDHFLAIVTEHNKTSCSDKNPDNPFLHNGAVECARCFLLRSKDLGQWDDPTVVPDPVTFSVDKPFTF